MNNKPEWIFEAIPNCSFYYSDLEFWVISFEIWVSIEIQSKFTSLKFSFCNSVFAIEFSFLKYNASDHADDVVTKMPVSKIQIEQIYSKSLIAYHIS